MLASLPIMRFLMDALGQASTTPTRFLVGDPGHAGIYANDKIPVGDLGHAGVFTFDEIPSG